MNTTVTSTRAPARMSHQAHHSGLRPLKKPTGFLRNEGGVPSVREPPLTWEVAYGTSPPIRRLSEFGECRTQMPSARPMRKPPMCEKLSKPGSKPSTNEMMMSTRMKRRSLTGLTRSRHE
ncbi:hypothetical protein MFIFM68171_04304 [Madurella fahalii]|uniref:Uncharacterized protein n=1 Tax=Madurella fahalii TaxID=1157608 RepID=A0ABQ0G8J3_9PEZI